MTALLNPIGHNSPPSDAEYLENHLRDVNEPLLNGAQKLIEAADRIPTTIEDEETAAKVSDFIKLVNGSKKNLENNRVTEKEPFLKLGRVVDGFFKTVTDSLDKAKARAQKPLDAYLLKKAAEERKRREEEAAALRKKQEEELAAANALEKANKATASDNMLEQAAATEAAAQKAQEAAEAKQSDMAKARGTMGAVASLRTRIVGEVVDMKTIDLEKLRPYMTMEAVQKALNLYVSAGGRELRGANIYEKSETVVR